MATYNFSPNQALDTGGELEFVTQKLKDSLDELWKSVNRFLDANQSISRDVYNDAQVMWSKGQEDMNRAMVKGTIALNEIHAKYVLADNKGAQVFGQSL